VNSSRVRPPQPVHARGIINLPVNLLMLDNGGAL
jgi:hypothetical protein